MILNQLDQLGFKADADQQADWNEHQLHLIAEAMRRAFRERAAHLGDADFCCDPGSSDDQRVRSQYRCIHFETQCDR